MSGEKEVLKWLESLPRIVLRGEGDETVGHSFINAVDNTLADYLRARFGDGRERYEKELRASSYRNWFTLCSIIDKSVPELPAVIEVERSDDMTSLADKTNYWYWKDEEFKNGKFVIMQRASADE